MAARGHRRRGRFSFYAVVVIDDLSGTTKGPVRHYMEQRRVRQFEALHAYAKALRRYKAGAPGSTSAPPPPPPSTFVNALSTPLLDITETPIAYVQQLREAGRSAAALAVACGPAMKPRIETFVQTLRRAFRRTPNRSAQEMLALAHSLCDTTQLDCYMDVGLVLGDLSAAAPPSSSHV